MIGEIFGQISCSWFPKHVVLDLDDSILYSIEPHMYCFVSLFMDFIIYYAVRGRVVCLTGVACCRWHIFSRLTLIGFPDFFLILCPQFFLHCQ